MAIHEKATVELQVNGEQARKEMQLWNNMRSL